MRQSVADVRAKILAIAGDSSGLVAQPLAGGRIEVAEKAQVQLFLFVPFSGSVSVARCKSLP